MVNYQKLPHRVMLTPVSEITENSLGMFYLTSERHIHLHFSEAQLLSTNIVLANLEGCVLLKFRVESTHSEQGH